MMNINYKLLGEAFTYYTNLGYKQVEVPWLIDQVTDDITRPKEKRSFVVSPINKNLVASGEQGFLQIIDTLEFNKKYFTVTPCFRDDKVDFYHQQYFMKLELFLIAPMPNWEAIHVIANDALHFFKTIGLNAEYTGGISGKPYQSNPNRLDCVYDIYTKIKNDFVELGSYGSRFMGGTNKPLDPFSLYVPPVQLNDITDRHVIFGTGLALPRAQIALLEQDMYAHISSL